jgi:Type ISP C-terminal specificity domain
MPAKGKTVVRDYTSDEKAAIEAGGKRSGLGPEQAFQCLGDSTYDVYLNAASYWKNVPARVWEYRIGGYQVIKKWLSYRAQPLLRRPLKFEEIKYVTEMVRRIAAILLLHPQLDANYEAVKRSTYQWPRANKVSAVATAP